MGWLIRGFSHVRRQLLMQERHVLVLRLTALLLVVHGWSTWWGQVLLGILCGAMLLSERLAQNRAVWLLTCYVIYCEIYVNQFVVDNHKYLMGYWSVACCCAVWAQQPDRLLSINGRFLIGCVFLFAVVWKILAGQYFDGSFLHFTFLSDPRVAWFAQAFGGLSEEDLAFNRRIIGILRALPSEETSAVLRSSTRIEWFTLLLSYCTLLVEGAVAVTFLVDRWPKLAKARDYTLFAFIGGTYFMLPVMGFAFLLVIMGMAQCDPARVRVRTAYLVFLVVVQLTRVPFSQIPPVSWNEPAQAAIEKTSS